MRRRQVLVFAASGGCGAAGGPGRGGRLGWGGRSLVAFAAVIVVASLLALAAGQARALARRSGPGGVISTIAGGVGGPGRATSLATGACGVQVASGSLYVGDFSTVRRISEATGTLATVAGNNAAGPVGDGGAAIDSAIGIPGDMSIQACGTTLDGAGNLVIADGSRVRVVAAAAGTFYGQAMSAGDIYTVAGQEGNDRSDVPAGDGGPAVKAYLFDAIGVSFDRNGNLLIADSGLPRGCDDCEALGALVRVVAARTGTFYGQAMTAGDIYTVAGTGASGDLGNGGLATKAWLGTNIGSVRPDRAGNLVIADLAQEDLNGFISAPSVRVVAARTGRFYGREMTAGRIYRVAGNGRQGSTGDGGLATRAALDEAGGVAVDGAGNLVVADGTRLRVVAARTGRFYGQAMTGHHIYSVAGTGVAGFSGDNGPAVRARVDVAAAAVDGAGNLVLAEAVRLRVVAARSGRFYGRAMTAHHIYTVAGNGLGYSGNGGPPLRAEFATPSGVTADQAGDLAFTTGNQVVNVVMAASGDFFGIRMTAGDLYTVAGNGSEGSSGDGGPARKAALGISEIGADVAFGAGGSLVVAEPDNDRVRLVAVRSGRFYGRPVTAGDIYTIAGTGRRGFSGDGGPAARARLFYPLAVSVDHHGNVLIADGLNGRVRVIAARTSTFYGRSMTAGDIYTVAGDGSRSYSGNGGPARAAGIAPQAVAVDGAGNLIVTDLSERVLVVAATTGTFYGQAMTAGDIYTIAGNGHYGDSGNGGPAASAEFQLLGGAAADRSGNVVVTDWSTSLVWVVAASTGTFYGQAMTAGHIYIVAGGGSTILGDGGPATQASLGSPMSVTVTPAGDLIITDLEDNRLRAVSP